MNETNALIENNRAWARQKVTVDPDFFARLVRQQSPSYLWIGCSDSRVPANEIVGLDPGELFVHRNVANLAPPQDANYLSVLQYAVEILGVRDILVVGHRTHAPWPDRPLAHTDTSARRRASGGATGLARHFDAA